MRLKLGFLGQRIEVRIYIQQHNFQGTSAIGLKCQKY